MLIAAEAGGLVEEAHQSLEILRCCGQKELLANKLQSPQAQTPQPDLWGRRRLDKRASGYRFAVVSAEFIAQDDRPTGALPADWCAESVIGLGWVLCRTPDMRRTGQNESENWVVIALNNSRNATLQFTT